MKTLALRSRNKLCTDIKETWKRVRMVDAGPVERLINFSGSPVIASGFRRFSLELFAATLTLIKKLQFRSSLRRKAKRKRVTKNFVIFTRVRRDD